MTTPVQTVITTRRPLSPEAKVGVANDKPVSSNTRNLAAIGADTNQIPIEATTNRPFTTAAVSRSAPLTNTTAT